MGIPLNAAYLMMIDGVRKPYQGSVLQLGKQTILFPLEGLQNLANSINFKLHPLQDGEIQPGKWLSDTAFFHALGFSEVLSMEFGTDEGADYAWDLNNIVPANYHEKFDAIYDGGTLEHVFNVPNVLSNVCSMLKIGGRAIHENPASGLLDHGFYSIQPTLYNDFYRAQNFDINLLIVSRQDQALLHTHTAEQIIYTPGMYDFEKTWAIDGKRTYGTHCIATKANKFETMVIPQQSIWARSARKS